MVDFKKLEEYILKLPECGIPACDITVYKEHECLFRFMTGYSDYDKKVPVTNKDLYCIYSNTKLFTVVATMQLVEQGKLSLDDQVGKYIPAYKNLTYITNKGIMPTTTPMTIYHLITMTSGLSYKNTPVVKKFISKKNGDTNTLEIISELAKEPLDFNPGDRWKYSVSHDVLGAIIEIVTGMQFGEYLKKNAMDPLGMQHTTFDMYDSYVQEHISALYSYKGESKTSIAMKNEGCTYFNQCRNFESGGAGLIAPTDDYILLVDALANGGVGKTGARILNPETIDKIRKPQLDVLKQSQFIFSHYKKGYGYGLGVRTLIDKGYGARSPIGEFAWDGMTGGYGLVDTDNHISVCYMQNVFGCDYAWHTVFPDTRDMIYNILGIED